MNPSHNTFLTFPDICLGLVDSSQGGSVPPNDLPGGKI